MTKTLATISVCRLLSACNNKNYKTYTGCILEEGKETTDKYYYDVQDHCEYLASEGKIVCNSNDC